MSVGWDVWLVFGCQDPVLSNSGLAALYCAPARSCSLFPGCAGQRCGRCSVKEGSKAVSSSGFLMRGWFLAASWELHRLPWQWEDRNKSGQNLLPDF